MKQYLGDGTTNMPISEEILNQIRANDACLTTLDLSQQQLTSDDISQLILALVNNTTIQELDLSECGLDNASAMLLAALHHPTLRILELSSNPEIDHEGASAFEHNTSYTTLSLTDNLKIGPLGAKKLVKNTTLKALDLGWCNVGDEGCDAILCNNTLESLSLMGNNITINGFKNLRGPHPSLVTLSIGFNHLGNQCVRWLAETLATSTKLIELDLRAAHIADRGVLGFLGNQTLRELDLRGNRITEGSIQQLRKDFSRHKLFEVPAVLSQNNIFSNTHSLTLTNDSDEATGFDREIRFGPPNTGSTS